MNDVVAAAKGDATVKEGTSTEVWAVYGNGWLDAGIKMIKIGTIEVMVLAGDVLGLRLEDNELIMLQAQDTEMAEELAEGLLKMCKLYNPTLGDPRIVPSITTLGDLQRSTAVGLVSCKDYDHANAAHVLKNQLLSSGQSTVEWSAECTLHDTPAIAVLTSLSLLFFSHDGLSLHNVLIQEVESILWDPNGLTFLLHGLSLIDPLIVTCQSLDHRHHLHTTLFSLYWECCMKPLPVLIGECRSDGNTTIMSSPSPTKGSPRVVWKRGDIIGPSGRFSPETEIAQSPVLKDLMECNEVSPCAPEVVVKGLQEETERNREEREEAEEKIRNLEKQIEDARARLRVVTDERETWRDQAMDASALYDSVLHPGKAAHLLKIETFDRQCIVADEHTELSALAAHFTLGTSSFVIQAKEAAMRSISVTPVPPAPLASTPAREVAEPVQTSTPTPLHQPKVKPKLRQHSKPRVPPVDEEAVRLIDNEYRLIKLKSLAEGVMTSAFSCRAAAAGLSKGKFSQPLLSTQSRRGGSPQRLSHSLTPIRHKREEKKMKKVKSTGEEQKKATGQKPRYVPEEEEEEYEVEQKEEGLLVKVSNCNEEFNDLSVRELLGEEGWAAVAEDGITWAVHKEELKFAGFGWIEFTDKKWAKTMVGFDVMGATSEKGKKVNRGDDLFVQYHDDGIPDGKCGWCGKNGHFARECNKRGREAMKYSPRYSKTGSSGSGYYDAKRQRQW